MSSAPPKDGGDLRGFAAFDALEAAAADYPPDDDASPIPSEYDVASEDEPDEVIENISPHSSLPLAAATPIDDAVAFAFAAAIADADGRAGGDAKELRAAGTAPMPKVAAAKSKAATKKKAPAKKSAAEAPESGFNAELRCAARVGSTVWAAERDGCIVVRSAESGKVVERILSGYDWDVVLCIAPVGAGAVWCGTQAGPILIFDKHSRTLQLEARQHSGGVHCLCPAAATSSRATATASAAARAAANFVCSGGADFRLNMWSAEGKLVKTYSGHRGAVRCVLVLGARIWTGSDDRSVRVWDAAYGVFQLQTEPCRAELRGHTAGVHGLLAHGDGVLSCSADGTVRCWAPAGSHECLREVRLACGPVYSLASMGRHVWAAGHDGGIHTLEGSSLEVVAPEGGAARRGHAGFVSGLCALQARTTRACWSFSTSDGKVMRWQTVEVEGQLTAERCVALGVANAALEGQLVTALQERRAEQVAHAGERARDEARFCQSPDRTHQRRAC